VEFPTTWELGTKLAKREKFSKGGKTRGLWEPQERANSREAQQAGGTKEHLKKGYPKGPVLSLLKPEWAAGVIKMAVKGKKMPMEPKYLCCCKLRGKKKSTVRTENGGK